MHRKVPSWSFWNRTAWFILAITLTLNSHIRTFFHHMDTLSTTIPTISPNKTFTHMFLNTLTTRWSLFWWINISPSLRVRTRTSIIAIDGKIRRNLVWKPLLELRLVLYIKHTFRRTNFKSLSSLTSLLLFLRRLSSTCWVWTINLHDEGWWTLLP